MVEYIYFSQIKSFDLQILQIEALFIEQNLFYDDVFEADSSASIFLSYALTNG